MAKPLPSWIAVGNTVRIHPCEDLFARGMAHGRIVSISSVLIHFDGRLWGRSKIPFPVSRIHNLCPEGENFETLETPHVSGT